MTQVVRGLAGAVVAFTLLVTPAAAAPRYVSPSGSPMAPCSVGMTCDLETGVEGAVNGDEVFVAPGNYGSPASPIASNITSSADIDVHGIDGEARPTLYTSASVGFSLSNTGATLTHFGLMSSHAGGGAAFYFAGSLADRVYASGGPAAGTEGCVLGGAATLRNSVCSGAGYAIEASGPVTLRGVTAWSAGSSGIGLQVTDGNDTVHSSILQGSTADVRANDIAGLTMPSITLAHSTYDTTAASPGAGPVTPAGTGTNQDELPLLADPANGDFHQIVSSPTVDKGAPGAVSVTGAFDIDGGPRSTGAGPDIGADEIAPPPLPPPPPPGGNGGNGTGPDGLAPSLTGLAFSPAAFLPLLQGPSIPSAASGSQVFYGLSEQATVGFRVERAAPGRRVGGRCRRPTRRNSSRRRCTRWVRVPGAFTHAGASGPNSFRFSGRLRNRALGPGGYRLVAVPVDPAGNRGKPARRAFRMLRRR